jgi:hypothetical protein
VPPGMTAMTGCQDWPPCMTSVSPSPVGMVFALLGAVGSVAALLLAHSRPDSRRWVIGGMVPAGVGATVFIVGGIVFGY